MASKAMSGVNKPTLIPDIIKNLYSLATSTNSDVLSQSGLTVNISDGKCNLFPQFLLVKLHPDYFVGESLMEEPVDLGSSTELHGVDSSTPTALYRSLKILLELLDHLEHSFGLDARVVRLEIFILFNLDIHTMKVSY